MLCDQTQIQVIGSTALNDWQTESKLVVASEWGMCYKGEQRTFKGNRNVLYLDDSGNTPVYAFVQTHLMLH